MEVRDVVPLEEVDAHAVILSSKEGTLVPVFIDESAAIAIAFRLARKPPPRALGEDLFDGVIKKLGGKVTEVQLDDFRNLAAKCIIIVRHGQKTYKVNARASDSIAAALSSGVQIFVTRRVVEEMGIRQEEVEKLREQMGTGAAPPPVNDGETPKSIQL
jgi:bifunctional DNase/RNase